MKIQQLIELLIKKQDEFKLDLNFIIAVRDTGQLVAVDLTDKDMKGMAKVLRFFSPKG